MSDHPVAFEEQRPQFGRQCPPEPLLRLGETGLTRNHAWAQERAASHV
ncbi:hypothetical protein [Streptomyces sp. NBC_00151]|nr:hypothetical protein [Streptomyces sp. NBC_00151]WRZ37055.1 hypothetical protein OG915_02650 [Streptomyces sp. NBC_00151]